MKSKSKIEKQIKNKRNPELVLTVIASNKNASWRKIAGVLTDSRKKKLNFNLNEIDSLAEDGKIVVVPGKVLSQGEFTKKNKIVAFKFSEKAKEKLLSSKVQVSNIIEEIKSNPQGDKIQVLRK